MESKESIYFSMQSGSGRLWHLENRDQRFRFAVCDQWLSRESRTSNRWRSSRRFIGLGSYNPNKAIQSEQAVLATIKAMYLYVPMLLILCSIVTMLFID